MHRPSIPELLKPGQSYYSLVVAVAKRAREIAQEADDQNIVLLEKPVQLAVDDFSKGRCRLIESDDIGVIHERQVSSVDAADLSEGDLDEEPMEDDDEDEDGDDE
ncbi:MAG: DNA-directed RNA polymerase subunit omega [Oscillospiraceae bacterium]|nr:DNA-directed RNA polymerase subunit omega [Oscillospiraceae bacterium]